METEAINAVASGIPATLLTTIGAGLSVFGAAFGIGKLATASVESMARQPEVAGKINTAMLIAAGMIEGAALFGIFVAFSSLG